MEIRLNKLISDSGLCSRREADRFIEAGRVTINGKPASPGDKVSDADQVFLDGMEIEVKSYANNDPTRATRGKAGNLIFGDATNRTPASRKKQPRSRRSVDGSAPTVSAEGPKREKYGRYNKYAAARKAAKAGLSSPFAGKTPEERQKEKILREATKPKFGKSLSKGAIAQRLAAAPKSAALRKTSKNNPVNKAKRLTGRNNRPDKPKGNR